MSKRPILKNLFLFSAKKIVTSDKEVNLRFSKQIFREESTPDNFINLWTYNYYVNHKPCIACDTYSRYCEEVLKEVWCNDWGNFDFVIEKIKNCDKNFININSCSEKNKWKILDDLIKKNKK